MKKFVLGLTALLVVGGLVVGTFVLGEKFAGDPPTDRPDSAPVELAGDPPTDRPDVVIIPKVLA